MRIPQLTDRMKEAPTQALRAVFAGIGQVLLAADRIRSRDAAEQQRAEPTASQRGEANTSERGEAATRPGPAGKAPGGTRRRSLDQTGNVRLLSAHDLADDEPEPDAPEPAAPSGPAAEPLAALPVPNYDELSLPSLRGRLRNLDPHQLRVLIDYEQANAGREAVVAMFERRIAKLQGTED